MIVHRVIAVVKRWDNATGASFRVESRGEEGEEVRGQRRFDQVGGRHHRNTQPEGEICSYRNTIVLRCQNQSWFCFIEEEILDKLVGYVL